MIFLDPAQLRRITLLKSKIIKKKKFDSFDQKILWLYFDFGWISIILRCSKIFWTLTLRFQTLNYDIFVKILWRLSYRFTVVTNLTVPPLRAYSGGSLAPHTFSHFGAFLIGLPLSKMVDFWLFLKKLHEVTSIRNSWFLSDFEENS